MLVYVYTCQNATLLEITCRGSIMIFFIQIDACVVVFINIDVF